MKELIYKDDARRAALHNEGEAVVAAIDEIKPVEFQGWIPVSERLPEKSGYYITFNKYGSINVYPYSAKHEKWNMCDWMGESMIKELSINSITYWMQLPQPPEVQE